MTTGLTFDTGMLVALERRRRRAEELLLRAREQRIVPVVPADVIVEWWQGRSDRREAILALVNVEPLSPRLACVAGEALAAVRGATSTDAVVMASAASRGDAVLTSDPDDLARLRAYFPSVRVLVV